MSVTGLSVAPSTPVAEADAPKGLPVYVPPAQVTLTDGVALAMLNVLATLVAALKLKK